MMLVPPGVKPSDPELAAHLRHVSAKLLEPGELSLRRIGSAKVDCGQHIGQRTFCKFLRAVRRVQQRVEASVGNHLPNGTQVSFVAAERTVFVFHLDHDDRTAIRDLKGSEFPTDALHVSSCSFEKPRICTSNVHGRRGKQPGRKPTKLPLRANVWTRSKDYPETFLLRGTNERGNVQIPVKVELAGFGFVQIPEDVSR